MNASSGVNAELKRLEQERESLEKQLQDRQPDRRALGNDDVLQQRLNERSEELAFAVKQIVELQDDAERKQKALDSGNKELQALKAELTCCRTELRAFRQGSRGVLPQGPAPVAGPSGSVGPSGIWRHFLKVMKKLMKMDRNMLAVPWACQTKSVTLKKSSTKQKGISKCLWQTSRVCKLSL